MSAVEAEWSRSNRALVAMVGPDFITNTEGVSFFQRDFETTVTELFAELRDLLLSKHRDYGPKNIADAPGGPLNGLAVRLHDKYARLAHLERAGVSPENESIADTRRDIINYKVIDLLVHEGHWPGVGAQ